MLRVAHVDRVQGAAALLAQKKSFVTANVCYAHLSSCHAGVCDVAEGFCVTAAELHEASRFLTRRIRMDEVEFHCEPPTNLPTMVVAFGGWVDAGEAATSALRFLVRQLGPRRSPRSTQKRSSTLPPSGLSYASASRGSAPSAGRGSRFGPGSPPMVGQGCCCFAASSPSSGGARTRRCSWTWPRAAACNGSCPLAPSSSRSPIRDPRVSRAAAPTPPGRHGSGCAGYGLVARATKARPA